MIKSAIAMQNDKLSKREMIKMGAGLLIGVAVDMTVTALVGRYLPSTKGWRRVMRAVGTFALGMKIGEDVENYFYQVYDETKDAIKEVAEIAKDAASEVRAEGAVAEDGE